ncbi:integral membrane protein [Motilibacter peucedani]|uniref:Integral membrane protein n=1 Tax=Motilibacter peucedani TaxID=598650 RepID=A0A420XKP9_9ACTN|nr:DUF3817 domain-containing protein [Motilibacter peucedani]RKS68590.1 integral membrane protein [Motilibacter peucedani]
MSSATTDAAPITLRTADGRFRIAAVAEACSWAALLIGMFFKYVVVKNQVGVQVFGPIHGAFFIAYVVSTLLVARAHRWSAGVTVVGLLASIPPFGTLVFERWAARNGRLSR